MSKKNKKYKHIKRKPRIKKVENLCTGTIHFVFDLDGECKFIKTKHYSAERNMFLAATFL